MEGKIKTVITPRTDLKNIKTYVEAQIFQSEFSSKQILQVVKKVVTMDSLYAVNLLAPEFVSSLYLDKK